VTTPMDTADLIKLPTGDGTIGKPMTRTLNTQREVERCAGCNLPTPAHAVSACGDLVTQRFYCSECNRAWTVIYGFELESAAITERCSGPG